MQCCCPNPKCRWSDPDMIPRNRRWYTSHGYYPSKQYGRIPRYICRNCHATFTLRTGGIGLALEGRWMQCHRYVLQMAERGVRWGDRRRVRRVATDGEDQTKEIEDRDIGLEKELESVAVEDFFREGGEVLDVYGRAVVKGRCAREVAKDLMLHRFDDA